MLLQPQLVLSEVRAHRSDQQGCEAEAAEPEGDVRGDTAAAYLKSVDEEGERDVGELLGQQLVRDPSGEDHQVVGGYRSCHRDAHGHSLGRFGR